MAAEIPLPPSRPKSSATGERLPVQMEMGGAQPEAWRTSAGCAVRRSPVTGGRPHHRCQPRELGAGKGGWLPLAPLALLPFPTNLSSLASRISPCTSFYRQRTSPPTSPSFPTASSPMPAPAARPTPPHQTTARTRTRRAATRGRARAPAAASALACLGATASSSHRRISAWRRSASHRWKRRRRTALQGAVGVGGQ